MLILTSIEKEVFDSIVKNLVMWWDKSDMFNFAFTSYGLYERYSDEIVNNILLEVKKQIENK